MGVSAWMTGSKLKLNPSKTEFLLIRIKLQREIFLNNPPCLILGQDTNPSTSAKNLVVVFDNSLNFRKHIFQTCRHASIISVTCIEFEQICPQNLPNKLQWHLSMLSKLDYCNSLFHNMSEKDIARLIREQNWLARVLKHTTRPTIFSLSDHDILSREWRVIVHHVQTNYHGGYMVL